MSVFIDIEKSFGTFNLKVKVAAADETLALLGASGCGKSMTLKCIAGIERPDRGKIVLNDRVLFDSEKKIDLSPQERKVGLMFQNYALFPNMTVLQNINAGAVREKNKAKRNADVERIMDKFGLLGLSDRYPHQISGGQQQRVALARMLVSAPDILLLDEPFSALDSHLRFNMEQEVRLVIREFGKTVIMVSHDRDEVYRMADSIAVMSEGRVETLGSKGEVFKNPETKNGAILTGCKNISRIENRGAGSVFAAEWGIELSVNKGFEQANYVGLRMHSIYAGSGKNSFRCRVVEEVENPFSYTIMLLPLSAEGGKPIGWELDKDKWHSLRAEEIDICFPEEALLPLK